MKQYINALPDGAVLKGKSCEYHIDRVLGQGAFGITYLASVKVKMAGSLGTIDANVKVAVKEFFMGEVNGRTKEGTVEGLTEGSMPYKYKQRFRKEAENLAKLNHPNIVKVIDFIEANETFYYVMEYIDGEDLYRYMDGQPLPTDEAISIIKEVGKALNYMHEEKKMMHLDLKPGNIMRRRSDDHIFLIDFGLTKVFDDNGKPETSTTVGQGTPGYAPLEQNSTSVKNKSFRPTIDVYSLGATLLKLLTAEAIPSASEVLNDDELLEGIMARHGVDGNIKNAILKAMKPRPKERTSSVRQFVHDIENLSDKNTQDVEATVYDSKSPVNATAKNEVVGNSHKQPEFQPNEKNEKYQEEYDKSSVGFFHDGRAKVKGLNGKYGFIDQSGRLVIPCRWKAAQAFSEGIVAVMDHFDKWGYIDKDGNSVIPRKWKKAESFTCGKAKVQDSLGFWTKIDKNGCEITTYIKVISNPEKAHVIINGTLVGFTPNMFQVTPGRHHIEITKEGWDKFDKWLLVVKGHSSSISVKLEQKSSVEVPGKNEIKVLNENEGSTYQISELTYAALRAPSRGRTDKMAIGLGHKNVQEKREKSLPTWLGVSMKIFVNCMIFLFCIGELLLLIYATFFWDFLIINGFITYITIIGIVALTARLLEYCFLKNEST